MGEVIQFNQLTTSLKSMQSINSDERYFEGLLTVQMKDKQGEVTIVDELYKVLPIWMDRGAPISDTHSNRIIGKGINYSKTIVKNEHGEDLPAIKITGKIYKNYELDNVIWDKIKNKEYKGLSFGGATRSNRTPMKMKDGSMAYALSNLEHYEVAVCKDPAVPMAVITDYNPIAKASFNSEVRDDGKMVIRCTNMGCFVEKSDIEHGKYGVVNTDTPFDATEDYEEDAPLTRDQFQLDNTKVENKANLNESQTFEEKVQALIKEGKSRESAEKIVGSFVHKDEVDKSGYQTENGNDKLGGQGATEDDKDKREKEDEEKEDDELKRRDHSDSNGDITSTYNQNVGREASSGRKLKADTTANQVGGIRGGLDPHFQGSGETNDINIVQEKPERAEDKGAANIKITIYTKKIKAINNSLVKHAQIQQLKKIKGSLPKSPEKYTEDEETLVGITAEGGNANQAQAHINDPKNWAKINDRLSSHNYTHTGKEKPAKEYTVGGQRFMDRDDTSRTATSLRRRLQKHAQIQELKKIKGSLPKKETKFEKTRREIWDEKSPSDIANATPSSRDADLAVWEKDGIAANQIESYKERIRGDKTTRHAKRPNALSIPEGSISGDRKIHGEENPRKPRGKAPRN